MPKKLTMIVHSNDGAYLAEYVVTRRTASATLSREYFDAFRTVVTIQDDTTGKEEGFKPTNRKRIIWHNRKG